MSINKLVSRLNETDIQLQQLRNIIEAATAGFIAPNGSVKPGATLAELVVQVDVACASLLSLLDKLDNKCHELSVENLNLTVKYAEQEQVISNIQDVGYDEELDHVTTDFMEALISSGAAEPTFDNEISFQSNVSLSREDLKPFVREVVDNWLRLKIR